ncbi:hypothetical protein XENTR_v10008581 [Xenopus tropicalis]|uniref:Bardet-Biedl syndrome 10 protein isoform X2 n=1 Tax=Xenopus tropicalis TaxID=8364 RepID=A0A8J0SGW0_XENTR|nr:Bardet-Biedl syndrome 10 protein isoform X2 [Xenopus tropicalis]KAE8615668.1 hypothetical protein XENTR_v10008581 [Xenopus tropicalis]
MCKGIPDMFFLEHMGLPVEVDLCWKEMKKYPLSLDLNKVLQVAESLENIVCRCFGPEGGHVLFIKSTGDLLITRDGRKILESLLLDHPVARIVVHSACNHASVTGDGVKSFVLLLCGVLRELQAAINKKDLILSGGTTRNQNQGHVLKRLSNLMMTFQTEILENIIVKQLSPHFETVFLKETNTLSSRTIQSVLDTYFSGRIGYNNRAFISRLVADYFHRCLPHNKSIADVVHTVITCFSELHTEVLGEPIENSKIISGIVLHRQFAVYCPSGGKIRAVIITEQFHQYLSASDVTFAVCSDAQLHLSQIFLRQRTEKLMKHLQNMEVRLILSTVKQPEIVLFYAKQNGISVVDCLPAEEIELVRIITGASSLSTAYGDIVSRQHLDTFLITCCQPVLLGSRKYVQLTFSRSLTLLPHSLVICGPVKGLTEQLVSAIHSAFKMLQQLFQPVVTNCVGLDTAKNQGCCKTRKRESVQEQNVTCSKYQKDSVCECNSHGISLNHSPESIKCGGHIGSRIINGDIVLQMNSPIDNTGSVLPGGGTFEMLLNFYLQSFAKQCQDAELALVCSVVGNALLNIPQNIYKAKKRNTCFLFKYAQFISALKNNEAIETSQLGLESASCKYQLVASVLHCISKLVAIDYIVGVKCIPPNTTNDESTDDV